MTVEPRISRNQFEQLRTRTLNISERLDLDVPNLRFAEVASWAVWAEPTPGNTNWSRDMTPLASYDTLAETIHAEVVFIALNKGVNPAAAHHQDDWAVFHSGRRDYFLAEALWNTPAAMTHLWGGYMTDFYKGLPTPTGADLDNLLDSVGTQGRARIEEQMTELLHTELRILAADDPLLICLGRATHDVVTRHLGDTHRIKHLTHYAHQITKEAYRAEVAALCAEAYGH